MRFGTLDLYVLRRVASVYGLCIATFVLLFLVVDGFSRLDEFLGSAKELREQGENVWAVAGRYYATKVPRVISIVGPYMTLFAGIATILSLARTNELVPMLTAGRSLHRVLLPAYLFAALAAGTLVLFEERVVPRATRENALLDRKVKDFGRIEVGRVPHLTDGPNRYSVGRWFPREQKLTAVVCQRFTDPRGKLPSGSLAVKELYYRRHPRTGVVGWYPVDGVLTPAPSGGGSRVGDPIRLPLDEPVPLGYTPDLVDVLADSAEEGIERAKLVQLQRQFPLQHKWTVDLHTRTTRPVASLVLFLLGIPFVASPEKRSIAWGLGLALVLCVGYFFADALFTAAGVRALGGIHAEVWVWTPPVLFTAVALALMDRVVT